MSSEALRKAGLVPGIVLAVSVATTTHYPRKTNVAHRGASSYAPEHTRAAYKLAIDQGADYVEQDLQITKDGVLVCLHDLTLERTTDVENVFPQRARLHGGRKTWPVADFTLSEIRQLDAGSWFSQKFAGERVPTWQEAIDLIRGRAGLFPETKDPEDYDSRGFDMAAMTLRVLQENGLDRRGADPRTPVIIQSFSPASLERLKAMGTQLPLILLISDRDPRRGAWLSDDGLKQVREFAEGIGPAKSLLVRDRTLAARAHALGLSITPYTFRAADLPPGQNVKDEMATFLYEIGADALFTDNPDQFPRR